MATENGGDDDDDDDGDHGDDGVIVQLCRGPELPAVRTRDKLHNRGWGGRTVYTHSFGAVGCRASFFFLAMMMMMTMMTLCFYQPQTALIDASPCKVCTHTVAEQSWKIGWTR